MRATQVHEVPNQRYGDFVIRNSTDGSYDTKKGLGALLSTVLEPKGVVLLASENGTYHPSTMELYRAVNDWLEQIGLPRSAFPLNPTPTWHYFEYERGGTLREGSLVKAGVVTGLQGGYQIASAGELAIPIILAAMDFVSEARESSVPHTYDSMQRTVSKNPIAVFRIVKFLVENAGKHRLTDLEEALEGHLQHFTVAETVSSLGITGVINYNSANRLVDGRRERGWATYSLAWKPELLSPDNIYNMFIRRHPEFYNRSNLAKIIEFIKVNPDSEYEGNDLSKRLGIGFTSAVRILSILVSLRILKSESGFRGGSILSIAEANDLTRLLHATVFEPALYSAETLMAVKRPNLTPEKVRVFLQNYVEESPRSEKKRSEALDKVILDILSSGRKRFTQIVEGGNEIMQRQGKKPQPKSYSSRLRNLVSAGVIEKTSHGDYRLPHVSA